MESGQNAHLQPATEIQTQFVAAYDTYHEALFRHAALRISNRERAIDIVQDTFVKAWSYVRSGHKIDSYRPFFYKILNNLIIDEYRKKKEVSLDALLDEEGVTDGTYPELAEDSEARLLDTLDGERAFALLDELGDSYKDVLILRYVDGLGPKEISQLLEVKENTVSIRLYRALRVLKQKIDAADEFSAEKRKAARRKQSK
jgi:RNA polymerase sigma-70 factor (ECF subfamily)